VTCGYESAARKGGRPLTGVHSPPKSNGALCNARDLRYALVTSARADILRRPAFGISARKIRLPVASLSAIGEQRIA
jgi:hypothetical protein